MQTNTARSFFGSFVVYHLHGVGRSAAISQGGGESPTWGEDLSPPQSSGRLQSVLGPASPQNAKSDIWRVRFHFVLLLAPQSRHLVDFVSLKRPGRNVVASRNLTVACFENFCFCGESSAASQVLFLMASRLGRTFSYLSPGGQCDSGLFAAASATLPLRVVSPRHLATVLEPWYFYVWNNINTCFTACWGGLIKYR